MMDALHFLAAPMALAFLLVGIHAYLGLHVLKREVIFIDISLSQVAALGGALALFFVEEETGEGWPLVLSLALCLFAAFSLAIMKKLEKGVPQEAIVAMTYALASGALILVADKLPHGGEHLKEALIGNILFVTWDQVARTALIYFFIAILHFIFRRQFWAASRGEDGLFWWDFLFYALFGVVITFSTRHAGVLVVFSILVAPAALAQKISTRLSRQLLLAWLIGCIGVLAAFILSYLMDWPSGAAIVCSLSALFFIVLGCLPLRGPKLRRVKGR